MAKINDLVIKSNKNDAWKDFFPQSRLSSDFHSRVLWLIHTAWDQDRDGTGNGAGTIGNNGSWYLSLSWISENISAWYYTSHLVPGPVQGE